jgi:hyperosmotically inducible protein
MGGTKFPDRTTMDNRHSQRAALAVAFTAIALEALVLAACDHPTTEQAKRDTADASRKVQAALERTGEKIADATRKATAEVKDAAHDAKAKTQDTASETRDRTGAAVNEAKSSDSGLRLSDAAITASIKTDYLKDPDLSVLKIDVDTKDGVVVLNGVASTPDGKVRAEKIASAIKGVREVRNHLSVKQG